MHGEGETTFVILSKLKYNAFDYCLVKINTNACMDCMLFFAEGENNEEPICSTTEVEILPSIDFCKKLCYMIWFIHISIIIIIGHKAFG